MRLCSLLVAWLPQLLPQSAFAASSGRFSGMRGVVWRRITSPERAAPKNSVGWGSFQAPRLPGPDPVGHRHGDYVLHVHLAGRAGQIDPTQGQAVNHDAHGV